MKAKGAFMQPSILNSIIMNQVLKPQSHKIKSRHNQMNYENVKKQYCCFHKKYFFPSSKKTNNKKQKKNKQKIQRTLWLND